MADRLSNVVRRKFVDYFVTKHGHSFVKSSPVKPHTSDNSLTFVNAGMNQFKPLFMADLPSYSPSRVCNYQKCIRVGGKMCDLDLIGHDHEHHTFFEMLGNWSFNDYGRQQACEWALDFLVNHLELDANKLTVTYYSSPSETDSETRDIWKKLGVKRVVANVEGDNFWEMGTSGPCGVSTEIFYPLGSELVEIWNIVFIDRLRMNHTGELVPLKSKFVDTGMGLERLLSVLEGTSSNYDTDVFRGLIKAIEKRSPVPAYAGTFGELDINYRTLVDHTRMMTIALADSIEPGRKGADFLLRSIIKKSVLISRDAFKQKIPRYLLFDVVDSTIDSLSQAYPELPGKVKLIRRTIHEEAKRYLKFLKKEKNPRIDEKAV